MHDEKLDKLLEAVTEMRRDMNAMEDRLSQRIVAVDAQGDRLSKNVVSLDAKLDRIAEAKADKSDTDQILTVLDGIASRVESDDQERAAVVSQLDRHEGWIEQLAKANNTKLSPKL